LGIREKERDGGGDNGQAQRDDGGGRQRNRGEGRAGGWAARIEQFGGVVRPVLYLRLKFGLRQYFEGVTWTSS